MDILRPSTAHTTAEAPGTHSTALEDVQQAGERTIAHILENICTPVFQRPITTLLLSRRHKSQGRRDQLSGFCKIERKLTEPPLCAGFRSALIIRYSDDNALKRFLLWTTGFGVVCATPNGTKRKLPPLVLYLDACPPPTLSPDLHSQAPDGTYTFGVRRRRLLPLSRAQHHQSMRSIGCPQTQTRDQVHTVLLVSIGASRDDSIQVLLLSHLRDLSTVTQTVGSMNNGRVVNDGLAAPAPI
ncbi:hypothetical protein B0H14DRAFT_3880056 [Mycena olivaceomarginata]|nr:hypothetical protein B0H14DRAFT_3880056 [Mycena olivaceomarginata]